MNLLDYVLLVYMSMIGVYTSCLYIFSFVHYCQQPAGQPDSSVYIGRIPFLKEPADPGKQSTNTKFILQNVQQKDDIDMLF